MKRMEMMVFCWMYFCDAEFKEISKNTVEIYEPLADTYGRDELKPGLVFPYLCYKDTIIFYAEFFQEIGRTRHHGLSFPDHLVLLQNRQWYEVISGKCEYREDQYQGWMMVWTARKNTRAARIANVGYQRARKEGLIS